MRAVLAVLRQPNFRWFFAGRCVSFLGNGMAPVALAFAVLELTGSATALGLVLAARTAPQLIFLVVGGVWADRLPRHFVLVGSSLLAGVSQAAAAALLIGGNAEVWQLVILEAVNGTAASFYYPSDTSVIPLLVSKDNIQEANSVLRLGGNATTIGGAALAGLLVAAFNPGWTVAIDAATFFAAAIFMAAMRGIDAASAAAQSFFRDLVEGWQEFTAHRWLWTIVLQFSVMLAAYLGGFIVLGPVVAEREMDGARSWALIVGAQSVGLLLGGLLMVRWRASRPILVATLAVFLHAAPLACLALTLSAWIVASAALAEGIAAEVFSVYWYTALHEHVAPGALSRVSAYDALGSISLSPIGMAVAGPLADSLGVAPTLWLAAGLIVGVTAATLLVPEVRNLRSGGKAANLGILPASAESA